MNRIHKLVAIVLFLMGQTLLAQPEVSSWARSYTYSCGYYSSSAADIHVTYRNEDLPWGTKVAIVWGYNGFRAIAGAGGSTRSAFEWQENNTTELAAISDGVWRVELNQLRLNSRSSSIFRSGIDFVLKITSGDGAVSWEQGSESSWGFYRLDLGHSRPCITNNERPKFIPVELQSIERS